MHAERVPRRKAAVKFVLRQASSALLSRPPNAIYGLLPIRGRAGNGPLPGHLTTA